MDELVPCSSCGNVPFVADVGGVNPYYEIYCGCGKNTVIGSKDKEEVINTWNVIQKGCTNDDNRQED